MKKTNSPAPKIDISGARRFLITLLIAGLTFTLGYILGNRGISFENKKSPLRLNISQSVPADKQNLDFDLFWQMWNTLDNSYFDKSKIDDGERIYGAIKGMVASIGDPYTVFLTPNENKVTQEDLSGNFEGIGIQIGFKGTQLAVISPLPGSPAEEAGVKAGDIIAGIKDVEKDIERGTAGITLPEAVQIIRGKAGSKITLSLIREGADGPIIVDVARKSIDVPSVTLTFEGENKDVAHIEVLKFGAETYEEWNEAILDILTKQDLKGIILDVRGNPGGYMQGAIDLAGDFVDKGDVVVIEEEANGKKIQFRAEGTTRLAKEKLVVLVNGGSASASEILAGALRDNNKTPLIGDITFGKGTIQEPKQLEGGAGLHITIARWLTPSEFWVNGVGLTPDIEIEDDSATIEDEQLQRAIEYILL